MFTNRASQSGSLNLTHLNNTALNFADTVCGTLAMPVELMLRPQFSSRYFDPAICIFATATMYGLPIVTAIFTGLLQLIPFVHIAPPVGLFGMGAFCWLYTALVIAHLVRLRPRIFDISKEDNSRYEGPPLPVFALLPWASFWKVRTVLEPLAVFLTAIVLQDLFLIDPTLAIYLKCAAAALMMKSVVAFYRSWQIARDAADLGGAGPTITRIIENRATKDDLAQLHIASFPEGVPEAVREHLREQLTRSYKPQ